MPESVERKQAGGVFAGSEKWFSSLVRNASDIITLYEADGTIRYVSPAIKRVLGYEPEERIGTDSFELVHPDDVARSKAAFAEALRRPDVPLAVEVRVRHRDGSWRHVEATGTNLLDDPDVGAIVLNSRDVTERRRAEERMRFQAQLLDAVGQALIATDPEGKVTYWNRAAEEMYGWSAEEMVDQTLRDFVISEDLRERATEIRSDLRDGKTWSGEFTVRRKDGTTFPVLITDTPVHDESGNLVGMIGLSVDITERKQAEKALEESELRLRTIVSNVPVVLFALDRAGVFALLEGRGLEALGLEPGEVVGRSVFEVYRDAPQILENVRRALSGEAFSAITEVAGLVFETWYSPVVGEEGEVAGVIGVGTDVTERRQAETRLREAEAKYRTLVEQIPAVVYIEGIDGRMTTLYESPQIEAMLGYPPDMYVRDPGYWAKIIHPDDRERLRAESERVSAGGEPFSLEYRVIARDGRVVWVRDEAVLLRNEEERPRFWQGILVDVTEHRRLEEELKEANRRLKELTVLKADFTAMVAHEIDAPIAVIRMFTEVLSVGELEPAERDRALDTIRAEIGVLDALTADLRLAASIERDDFGVSPERIAVAQLLEDAAAYARTLPGDHPLVVEGTEERVWADPYRIGQVLRNLLSNAAKYSPDGAPIELRARPVAKTNEAPERVCIEVADHGPGVHPDDVARIFEKFGRGRDRFGRRKPGVGLGLYTSRRILRAHGSELELDSTPGAGTVFGFELEIGR